LPFKCNLQRYNADPLLMAGGLETVVGLCTSNQVDP
jgi:hypothetical protein